MERIHLSNHHIITALNFAEKTVEAHYTRMWHDPEIGVAKIMIGKLGETAVSTYCSMIGVYAEPNFRVDTGPDTGDLFVQGKLLAVKTKAFTSEEIPSPYEVFLHVPTDQYANMRKHRTAAILAVCLHTSGIESLDDWSSITRIDADVVGGLVFSRYQEIKVLHKEGQLIAPGFRLPPPDSYAVSWARLDPPDGLITDLARQLEFDVARRR